MVLTLKILKFRLCLVMQSLISAAGIRAVDSYTQRVTSVDVLLFSETSFRKNNLCKIIIIYCLG